MMTACGAAVKSLFIFAMENHLVTGVTFDPQIIRHIVGLNPCLDFGKDRICNPIHCNLPMRV